MLKPCAFCGDEVESSFINKYVFIYQCFNFNCQAKVEIIAANQKAADDVFNSRFINCRLESSNNATKHST